MSLEKESALLTSAIIKLIILFDWQKPFCCIEMEECLILINSTWCSYFKEKLSLNLG